MAIELIEHNITVNCVSTGPLDTPCRWRCEEAMQAARESWPIVPMNRLGQPTEIADIYAYTWPRPTAPTPPARTSSSTET